MANNITAENLIYFNGVNGSTGKYDVPPIPIDKFVEEMLKNPRLPEMLKENKPAAGFYKNFIGTPSYGLADGRDPEQIKQTGWGVIFAHDEDPAVIEALAPLLKLRREQAGNYYYEYVGSYKNGQEKRWGYFYADKTSETKEEFLTKRGAEPFGPADPKFAPYYLLIVGGPEKIPYKFQYQLDIQYAVGRIYFRSPQEYAQYAQNVVDAETKKLQLSRQAVFFGVENPGDGATNLSANHLIKPLLGQLQALSEEFEMDWKVKSLVKDKAYKKDLSALLNGNQTPSLLFTASHGLDFNPDDKRIFEHQGALLCQDWTGETNDFQNEQYYFSADDLETNANLLGLMAFNFACFSAGTPRQNNFLLSYDRDRPSELVSRPFVARLPQRLLLNGALAVIGHIERAWGVSIAYTENSLKDDRHLATYRSTMKRLMDGHPIGSALEYFNEKYGEYSAALTTRIEDRKLGLQDAPDDYELIDLWRGNNDARNFVIIGDPAARLPLADVGQAPAEERPVLTKIAVVSTQPSTSEPQLETAPPPVSPSFTSSDVPLPQGESYGLRETSQQLADSLKDASGKISSLLQSTFENMTTLQVLTYTSSDDLKKAYNLNTKEFSDEASLKAVTRIDFDGDISHIVPVREKTDAKDGKTQTKVEIDKELWTIHREMVNLAQENKVAFVKAMAEIAGTLIGITGGK